MNRKEKKYEENRKEIIKKIMEVYGLEIGQYFTIDYICDNPYYFDENYRAVDSTGEHFMVTEYFINYPERIHILPDKRKEENK